MRNKTALFIVSCLLLLVGGQQLKANERQRLVFNAAGNIGLTALIVESQGITPENPTPSTATSTRPPPC
jgi:hypothetical protein